MKYRLLTVAPLLLLGATAYLPAAAADANRLATEKAACAHMGLAEGTAPFAGCVATLDRSLAEQEQAQLLTRAQQACAQSGLKSGTPGYATCVLDGGDARAQAAAPFRSSDAR